MQKIKALKVGFFLIKRRKKKEKTFPNKQSQWVGNIDTNLPETTLDQSDILIIFISYNR